MDPQPLPVRRSIGSMEIEHRRLHARGQKSPLDRFYEAVEEMVITGEYDNLASIHGDIPPRFVNLNHDRIPGPIPEGLSFCAHRQEAFGVWHTGYLIQFDALLSQADKNLGNDGNIACPYWDWENDATPSSLKRYDHMREEHPLPDVVEERMESVFGQAAWERHYLDMKRMFPQTVGRMKALAKNAQSNLAFVTANSDALESVHNLIHVQCGNPMRMVPLAAYDLVFFLHHCNVERYFRAYLDYQGPSNVNRRHEHDTMETREPGRYMYDSPLTPMAKSPPSSLVNPVDAPPGGPVAWKAVDAYTPSTTDLGYTYDSYPTGLEREEAAEEDDLPLLFSAAPPTWFTAAPAPTPAPKKVVRAVVPGIKLSPEMCGNTVYTFVHRAGEEGKKKFEQDLKKFTAEQGKLFEAMGFEYFAGLQALFLRDDPSVCGNCQNPISISQDITAVLDKLQLRPDQAELAIMVAQYGEELHHPTKFEFPTARITWPGAKAPSRRDNKEEVPAPPRDGVQAPRFMSRAPGGGEQESHQVPERYFADGEHRYRIHGSAEGWSDSDLRKVVDKAFRVWCGEINLTFKWAPEYKCDLEKDVVINFDASKLEFEVNQFASTVPGKRVDIDGEEYWCKGVRRFPEDAIPLFPVLLREVGRLLGMPEEATGDTVMAPLSANLENMPHHLTKNDKEKVKEAYKA